MACGVPRPQNFIIQYILVKTWVLDYLEVFQFLVVNDLILPKTVRLQVKIFENIYLKNKVSPI